MRYLVTLADAAGIELDGFSKSVQAVSADGAKLAWSKASGWASLRGAARSLGLPVATLSARLRLKLVPEALASEKLDEIAAILDGQEWNSETSEAIARIVRSTGRTIRDPND